MKAVKLKYFLILGLVIFFVAVGVRLAPGVSQFLSFNREFNALLDEALQSTKEARKEVSKSDLNTYDSGVNNFVGLIIDGQKYVVQKTSSLKEMAAIVDASSVYLYSSKDVQYEKMQALCFVSEQIMCIPALKEGSSH